MLAPLGGDLYPRMFLAPDGRVFKAGPDQDTWWLDTSGLGSWVAGPPSNGGFRSYGPAVIHDGEVLIMGGGDPPMAAVEQIDLNEADSTWAPSSPW